MILNIYQILGWAGVVLIILSYFLHLKEKLKNDYVLYHLLNFLGASGIIISTFMTKSWPAMSVGILAVILSVYFIFKLLKIKPDYKELR